MSEIKVYTANQPLFFPAMYMIERFSKVDDLVIMEEAQFSKFGHQTRAEIASKNGRVKLVLPLKDRSFKRLNDVFVLDPDHWLVKFYKTMQAVYGKSPHFKEHSQSLLHGLHSMIDYTPSGLLTQADVGRFTIEWACKVLQLPCKLHSSLDLVPVRPEDANEWIIALGSAINCNRYLGGKVAGDAYMDMSKWQAAGIEVAYQDWKMPPYTNAMGQETDGSICFLDALFTGGTDLVNELIGRQ